MYYFYKFIERIVENVIVAYRNLNFLNKCKRLGIVLLNNDSELILEDFVYLAYALKVREFLFRVEVKVEIENLEKLTADLLHEEYY